MCTSLRYEPTQTDFQPVLDVFGTMDVLDASFIGLDSQRYCLDTSD